MGTLVDTNVLSELMRPQPDAAVVQWIDKQPASTLFVSAVTQGEIMLGLRSMPQGKRRKALEALAAETFDKSFAQRILPFDSAAVAPFVDITTARRAAGRPIGQFDAQIGAIAKRMGLQLATRNRKDFEGCGIKLVDSWLTA